MANSIWFHYQLREFTINYANSLSFSRYQHGSFIYVVNPEFIHYLFREFDNIENLLWICFEISLFHYQVNSLWIHHDFRRFTMNSFSVSRIPFVLAKSKNNQLRELPTHPLSVPRILNKSIIIFTYSLWIHYQLHE